MLTAPWTVLPPRTKNPEENFRNRVLPHIKAMLGVDKRVQLIVRLEPVLHAKLKKYCRCKKLSMQEVVAALIWGELLGE